MPWILIVATRLSLAVLPVYLYIGFRLINAMSIGFSMSIKTAQIIVFSVILWFYFFPLTISGYYLTGNLNKLFVFDLQLGYRDYIMLFPFWVGFITLLEILPFFLLTDIVCLISNMMKFFIFKEKWLIFQSYLKIIVAIFFLLYVGVRAYLDTAYIRISTYKIEIKTLPEAFKNLSICLISDIHVDRYTQGEKLKKLTDKIRGNEEDLIFFAGDLISEDRKHLNQALDIVCSPQHKIAAFACLGDHEHEYDYYSTSPTIIPVMEKCGWKFLQNQHQLILYNGCKILVTGISHTYTTGISEYDLDKLLSNAPKADLKILLVHQPKDFIIELAAKYSYHLLLAGHTHGGQIFFHPLGIPITPNQFETRFYNGQHKFKALNVVVTNGIGLSVIPLRYHAPGEIIRLVLNPPS